MNAGDHIVDDDDGAESTPAQPHFAQTQEGGAEVVMWRLSQIEASGRRMERQMVRVLSAQGTSLTSAQLLDQRVFGLEAWRKAFEDRRSQLGIGTWLAITSAVASPTAVILFETFRHVA